MWDYVMLRSVMGEGTIGNSGLRVYAVLTVALLLALPSAATAQAPANVPTISPAMDRAVARARAAVNNGEGNDARAVLDSLVNAAPSGSNDLAEALYWRAALAERAGDAERDWKRLVIEVPLAPRASDALLRLGEFEMLRGHPAEARSYFARIAREYPAGMGKARGQFGVAKSWVAQRDLPRACIALSEAMASGIPEGELRLQAEEMGRQCATVDRKLIAKVAAADAAPATEKVIAPEAAPAPVNTAEAPANARFSVQLAAFDTREEGERLVKRLASRNIEARVDGDVKPFRVRSGYYATRAEANAALAKLKKSGQAGFIAEIAK